MHRHKYSCSMTSYARAALTPDSITSSNQPAQKRGTYLSNSCSSSCRCCAIWAGKRAAYASAPAFQALLAAPTAAAHRAANETPLDSGLPPGAAAAEAVPGALGAAAAAAFACLSPLKPVRRRPVLTQPLLGDLSQRSRLGVVSQRTTFPVLERLQTQVATQVKCASNCCAAAASAVMTR